MTDGRRSWCAGVAALLTTVAYACAAGETGADVTVLATRIEQADLGVAAAVDRVDAVRLRAAAGVNLSEALGPVAGVSAESRSNYAQDVQLSIRGFGARSTFGVRGVRLYADGIPGTLPDGQGQFSHFDLTAAEHVEVLRGPYSALYGNSAGGVLAITTAPAPDGLTASTTVEAGTAGLSRYVMQAGDGSARSNWTVDASHFEIQGERAHSAAARTTANGKWRLELAPAVTLTLVANRIGTPDVEDPLGLTAAQLAADRTQAGTNAQAYNTRKRLEQAQGGAQLEARLGPADVLSISGYGGERSTTQFQAILRSAEQLATNPGGVIGLQRNYDGGEIRYRASRALAGRPLSVTVGLSLDDLAEDRRGYLNFLGSALGVEGALRRHDANHADAADEYAQAEWQASDDLTLMGGVRHTRLRIDSQPLLGTATLTRLHYAATDPVASVLYRLAPAVVAYASAGRGFETPTLNDLAYRSTNGSVSGLNSGLQPASSRNVEVGLKTDASHWRTRLAAFGIRTENELAVAANAGGRAVYENIGPTSRRGAEWSLTSVPVDPLSATLAVTVLDARTLQSYRACVGVPCIQNAVAAGNWLPAVPRQTLYADLHWRFQPDADLAVETIGRGGMYADDRNTAWTGGYWSSNLVGSLRQTGAHWRLDETLRLDNVLNRRYVSTVIVNETNGRYYEPSPGRTVLLIVSAAFR